MNRINICKKIIRTFKKNIHSEEYLNSFRLENHFVRKRKLSMFHVVLYLFYSGLQSMPLTISNIRFDLKRLNFPMVSRQAVSKARTGISPLLFRSFFALTSSEYYRWTKKTKKWNGYSVFAIDGTKIELPATESIFSKFGVHYEKNGELFYSNALGSVLYDVLEDVITDANIYPSNYSERNAAKAHLLRLEEMNLHKKSVIIMDRGYFSEELYRHICDQNYFCLFRIQKKYRIAKNMMSDDETKYLEVDHSKFSTKIKIRVIKVELESGETEYLATNIMDSKITREMFKELYFKRWKIETKYHEIKERHYLEEFTGATSISIEQEFFITMGIANLCCMIKQEADKNIIKRATTDKQYQSNRSYIIGRMKKLLPRIIVGTSALKCIDDLLEETTLNKSLIQPNRKYKRRKKRGPKRKHFKNRKTTT